MKPLHLLAGVALLALPAAGLHAQQSISDGTTNAAVNPNAVLEMQSANKGMLLPRVALTATENAAPLTAHVAGMHVYNTATAGTAPNNVTPGEYYNGAKWVRVSTVDDNTQTYGGGAPTDGCASGTTYTDTLTGSPSLG